MGGTRSCSPGRARTLATSRGRVREHAPLIEVLPLKPAKVGIVTTGSEVYTGRIWTVFGPG